MAQMKRSMWNTITAGKAGSGVKKAKIGPSFKPGSGTAGVRVESVRERKDRLLG